MFKDMRVQFCKKGDAIYFSHLDLQRSVQRALRRSGIPYWSTGGFSPHPYCIFAQPLSLGFESQGELFDFRVIEGEPFNPEDLAKAFPDSLKVVEIYSPEQPFKKITAATYEIELDTQWDANAIQKAFREPLMALKKTKRSEKEVDIREFIDKVQITPLSDGIKILCNVATGNERSLNPNYIEIALNNAGYSCSIKKVTRICFLDEQGKVFR